MPPYAKSTPGPGTYEPRSLAERTSGADVPRERWRDRIRSEATAGMAPHAGHDAGSLEWMFVGHEDELAALCETTKCPGPPPARPSRATRFLRRRS